MDEQPVTREEFHQLLNAVDKVAKDFEQLKNNFLTEQYDTNKRFAAFAASVDERFKVAGPIAPQAVREICHDCGSPAHQTGACR